MYDPPIFDHEINTAAIEILDDRQRYTVSPNRRAPSGAALAMAAELRSTLRSQGRTRMHRKRSAPRAPTTRPLRATLIVPPPQSSGPDMPSCTPQPRAEQPPRASCHLIAWPNDDQLCTAVPAPVTKLLWMSRGVFAVVRTSQGGATPGRHALEGRLLSGRTFQQDRCGCSGGGRHVVRRPTRTRGRHLGSQAAPEKARHSTRKVGVDTRAT